jgi:hypothetical protein
MLDYQEAQAEDLMEILQELLADLEHQDKVLKVELQQHGGLFGPLELRRLLESGESRQLPLSAVAAGGEGSAQTPSHASLAA